MKPLLFLLTILAAMPSPVTIPQMSNTWTPSNVPIDAVVEQGSASQVVGLGSAKMKAAYLIKYSVNVKAYGAVGDGVTDDATAINAAAAAALALAPTFDTTWTVPPAQPSIELYFPKGKYLIGAPITLPQRVIVRGENSFIIGSGAITLFSASAFGGLIVDGFHFAAGTKAIYITNGNVSAAWAHITNCYFEQQTVAAIDNANDTFSTTLRIDNCYIETANTIAVRSYCDQTTIENCWVNSFDTGGGTISPIYNYGGMVMDKVFFTPSGATVVNAVPFVANYGPSFKAAFCRFGGELSGKEAVGQHTGPSVAGAQTILDLQRNSIWGTSSVIIRLIGVPDILIIKNNEMTYGAPFVQLTVMPGYTLATNFLCDLDERIVLVAGNLGSETAELAPFSRNLSNGQDNFKYDNVIGAAVSRHFSGFTDVENLGTGGGITFAFDDSASNPFFDDVVKVVSGSANATGLPLKVQLLRSPTALAAGFYTFGFYVKSNKAFSVIVNNGYSQKVVQIEPSDDYGPVWIVGYNDASRTTVQLNASNLPLNATFFLACPFLYQGVMNSPVSLDLYAISGIKRHRNGFPSLAAAPGSGAGSVVTKGTTIWNNTVATGQPLGWINTHASSTTTDFVPFGQQGFRTFAAAPGVDAYFVGEEAVDTVAKVWYKAVTVGSGASDWVALN